MFHFNQNYSFHIYFHFSNDQRVQSPLNRWQQIRLQISASPDTYTHFACACVFVCGLCGTHWVIHCAAEASVALVWFIWKLKAVALDTQLEKCSLKIPNQIRQMYLKGDFLCETNEIEWKIVQSFNLNKKKKKVNFYMKKKLFVIKYVKSPLLHWA